VFLEQASPVKNTDGISNFSRAREIWEQMLDPNSDILYIVTDLFKYLNYILLGSWHTTKLDLGIECSIPLEGLYRTNCKNAVKKTNVFNCTVRAFVKVEQEAQIEYL
jgi:hypothetical protein